MSFFLKKNLIFLLVGTFVLGAWTPITAAKTQDGVSNMDRRARCLRKARDKYRRQYRYCKKRHDVSKYFRKSCRRKAARKYLKRQKRCRRMYSR